MEKNRKLIKNIVISKFVSFSYSSKLLNWWASKYLKLSKKNSTNLHGKKFNFNWLNNQRFSRKKMAMIKMWCKNYLSSLWKWRLKRFINNSLRKVLNFVSVILSNESKIKLTHQFISRTIQRFRVPPIKSSFLYHEKEVITLVKTNNIMKANHKNASLCQKQQINLKNNN